MYTRGQFALISKTTLKALRLYEELELLKPDFIDENRYHYYSLDKVSELLFINEMKSYGFSLEEIKSVKNKVDDKSFCEILKQKHKELEHNIQSQRQILDMLEQKIQLMQSSEKLQDNQQEKYFVDIVSLQAENAICCRDLISIADVGRLIGKAYEYTGQYSLEPTDTHRIIYHNSDNNSPEESWDLEVCIPVKNAFESDTFSTRRIESGIYARTLHMGSFSQSGKAHAAIVDWVAINNYEIIGDPFEKIKTGKQAFFNPNSIEIEVYYPVSTYEREEK
ncbi:MAG: MerR family transcriptional regulator [Clostridiales bacterium]|nr:MerR family transcriptional regulator [Clostridiales bacterium]